jgi:hypothetical protein
LAFRLGKDVDGVPGGTRKLGIGDANVTLQSDLGGAEAGSVPVLLCVGPGGDELLPSPDELGPPLPLSQC